MKRLHQSIVNSIERLHAFQDWIADRYFRAHGITLLYWAYGFVFFYFGLQKIMPAETPVDNPIRLVLVRSGLPLAFDHVRLFIGSYEMIMGTLFFLKRIRIVFWLFFLHQFVGFISLVAAPYHFWFPPWIPLFGVDIPFYLGNYAAFVLKNLVFIAAFLVLASYELGNNSPDEPPHASTE